MREIKFRGYDKELEIWVFGYYIKRIDSTPCMFNSDKEKEEWYKKHVKHLICNNGFSDSWMPRKLVANIVDGESVGQYTGLKDMNGKEIYEGDLLRYPARDNWETENYALFEVFYHDNDGCGSNIGFQIGRTHYKGSLCGGRIVGFKPENTSKMVIEGNIYEN